MEGGVGRFLMARGARSLGRLSSSREPRHDASVTRRALAAWGLASSGERYRLLASRASLCPIASHAIMFTNASKCLATPRAILSTCSRPRAHTVSIANTKVPKCTIFSVAPAPRRTCVSLQDTYTLRLPYRFPSSSQPSRRHISSAQDGAIKEKHRAFIALGSNMGDRVAMIERACRELESNGKVDIIQTSSLWESKAMYVVNQDNFVNGACEVCYVFTQFEH
jgi:hypothetical protein